MQTDDIKLPAEIEALQREPVVYKGQRVMTTELLAIAYGTDAENIRDNHRRNEERFIEGAHYVKLVGADLRAFKNQPAHSRLVGTRAPHLVLWLDRGAARHAKLIQTDEAWEVFEKLEDAYFHLAGERRLPASVGSTVREAVTVFSAYKRLGRLIGLDKNQALIAANQATLKRTGENMLDAVGVRHLTAPEQESILTPSEIGARLGGLSAQAVNKEIAALGLQVSVPHGKGKTAWEPTPAGEHYAKWQDTGKRHGDGVPVRQLKWLSTLLRLLRKEAA